MVVGAHALALHGHPRFTEDFLSPDQVVQLDNPPNRVDLLTGISGVDWASAASGALEGSFGDTPVRFLGRDELIANKRATGRLKELPGREASGGSRQPVIRKGPGPGNH